MKKTQVDKVARRRNVDNEGWTELKFERRGGTVKYDSPTLKVAKHGIALYKTDLADGQAVRLFKKGSRVAIIADDGGPKKLKANKSGTKMAITGKCVVRDLKLEVGAAYAGVPGNVKGKDGWIFG